MTQIDKLFLRLCFLNIYMVTIFLNRFWSPGVKKIPPLYVSHCNAARWY